MSDLFHIPLCRSEFLQDFSIQLGVKLRSRFLWGGCTVVVDMCDHQGEELERFSLWIHGLYRTRINLVVWENKILWISVAHVPQNGEKFQVGFYLKFESLGAERVVEALLETESIATCLCYDESPEPLMRQIWKHTGEVEIEGVI